MLVYPLKSDLVKPGDSILELLSAALARNNLRLRARDIVAVSSKIIAISEKRIRNIGNVTVTREARTLAKRFVLAPPFAQAVLDEADSIIGGVKGAVLTIKNGEAVPNAGVDRKNAPNGSMVLWPRNADANARTLQNQVNTKFGKKVGVVIVDSRVAPLRLGTTGFAIGSSGFRPVEDLRGARDLSRRPIEITFQAVADGIAATAQLVMGEAAERTPFVIIRDAPIRLNYSGGIHEARLARDECLYMSQIPSSRRSRSRNDMKARSQVG